MTGTTQKRGRSKATTWTVATLVCCTLVALAFLTVTQILPGSWRVRAYYQERKATSRLDGFKADAPRVPAGSVVFIGSSSIVKFPMEKLYADLPWVNRGMGSETAIDLLLRLDKSLPDARPAGVVIYAGANDVRSEGVSPACTTVGVEAVINAVTARFPGVPIALLEAMPIVEERDEVIPRFVVFSKQMRELAKTRGAVFISTMRPPLAEPSGRLAKAMSDDGQHLNDAGYVVLARWIADEGGAATAPLRAAAK